jgi:hypothetical protein
MVELLRSDVHVFRGSTELARSAVDRFLAIHDRRVAIGHGFVLRPNGPRSAVTGAR